MVSFPGWPEWVFGAAWQPWWLMMIDRGAAPSIHDKSLTSQLARTSARERELDLKDCGIHICAIYVYVYSLWCIICNMKVFVEFSLLLSEIIKIIKRSHKWLTSVLVFSLTCLWVTAHKLLPRNGLLCFHFVLSPTLSLHPSSYYECFSSGPKIKRTQMSAVLYWCF